MLAGTIIYVQQRDIYNSWPIVDANVTGTRCNDVGNGTCTWTYADANSPPGVTDYYGSFQVVFINPWTGVNETTYIYTWDDFPEISNAGSVDAWLYQNSKQVNWPIQINPGYRTGSIPGCPANAGVNSDDTSQFSLINNCAVEWPGVIDDSSDNKIWMIVMWALFGPVCLAPLLAMIFLVCKPSCDCSCLKCHKCHPSCPTCPTDCCKRKPRHTTIRTTNPVAFTAPPLPPVVVATPIEPEPPAIDPYQAPPGEPEPSAVVAEPVAATEIIDVPLPPEVPLDDQSGSVSGSAEVSSTEEKLPAY